VSIVSSGDEKAAKEYIHPRGRAGRRTRQILEGPSRTAAKQAVRIANAYQKTAFDIVHVRTDGERALASTHSGKTKESYAFRVNKVGEITFEPKARVL
jgi:hypothetical protein